MDREALFWEIVHTAPRVEADEMLRQRKHDALDRSIKATDSTERRLLAALITKINDELHRINRVNEGYHTELAIRALFGSDAWAQVKGWKEQNPMEPR